MKKVRRLLSVSGWLVLLALIFIVPAMLWRVSTESLMHNAQIIFDLRQLSSLRAGEGVNKYAKLLEAGISGFLVPEYTGEEIGSGCVSRVSLSCVDNLSRRIARRFVSTDGTVVVMKDAALFDEQLDYLKKRFSLGETVNDGDCIYFRIPESYERLKESGMLPDIASMKSLSEAGVPMIYGLAPAYSGTVEELMASFEYLLNRYSSVKALCPAGEISPAYPYSGLLADCVKRHGIFTCKVEFSLQYGARLLERLSWPNVVAMHAVDRREVVKRGMTREAMLNRLVRAARERGVSLLLLRTDPLRGVAPTMGEYTASVKTLRTRLDAAGFSRLWKLGMPAPYSFNIICAYFSMNLLLAVLVLALSRRIGLCVSEDDAVLPLLMLAAAGVLTVADYFLPGIFRLCGALTAAFLATEASLRAMDLWRVPVRGAVEGFCMALLGGLILCAPYSVPEYMLRMSSFSGVKLTLLLPPVFVLLLDLYSGEHHENLPAILKRAPFWGELVVCGILAIGALVMLLRSGNYGFVGGGEMRVRSYLENLLTARPRTKEILFGYPALVLWYYLKRKNILAHWREIFRVTVTLTFSSVVNSFCHMHTPLGLTFLRELHGFWIGSLLGVTVLMLLCASIFLVPFFFPLFGISSVSAGNIHTGAPVEEERGKNNEA